MILVVKLYSTPNLSRQGLFDFFISFRRFLSGFSNGTTNLSRQGFFYFFISLRRFLSGFAYRPTFLRFIYGAFFFLRRLFFGASSAAALEPFFLYDFFAKIIVARYDLPFGFSRAHTDFRCTSHGFAPILHYSIEIMCRHTIENCTPQTECARRIQE
jgi:hypothetical protein